MGTFFVYILKSAVCLALFYLFYRLLLSRETFHRFNRIALLCILLFSFLLPFIEITTTQQTEVHQTVLTLEQLLMMASIEPSEVPMEVESTNVLSGIQIALLVYLAGILFFACRNIYSLTRLLLLLRRGKREKMENGRVLVVHKEPIAPFSWMKYIVISENDLAENGREILIHEMAHIRNRHSLDLLVADICIFFQWFNPASWLLKQELQNIHEYEADETVIKEGVDAKQYQLLLIKKAVGTRLYSMANSFNHSKLKKRITMMLKEKSSPWARLKYLYVLPLAAIAVTAFARPEISNKAEEISAVKVNDLKEIVETKILENHTMDVKDVIVNQVKPSADKEKVVFEVVEKMPEYPGGVSALMKFISSNLKYPAAASKAGLEGRVYVQFIVSDKGKVEDAKISRSGGELLDKEALRVINIMPEWIPGQQKGKNVNVRYTLPIVFSIPANQKVTSTSNILNREDDVLVIIDGKEASMNILKAIGVDKVESLSVLKPESGKALYGEKGSKGVFLVTLKSDIKSDLKLPTPIDLTEAGFVKVFGSVKGENGSPLIGASVLLAGTSNGTITDAEGNFIIQAPKNGTIQVSYADMQTEKVGVAPKVNVTLKAMKAQSGLVKMFGSVKSEDGSPVIGASVLIAGTTNGTITDAEGNFIIQAPKDGVIQISYAGMQTEKVGVAPKVNVTLKVKKALSFILGQEKISGI